jgi:Tol biopolymer transport system component/predicted Ser/Thr protein kinase
MIGQTLSHYQITAALGAGGMGEVYRATDTNLNREVAIKVLPPEVGEDPERLGRFRREAHLLAALNHPNIAAIYGLEEADGKPFLAMELVEGEDLKERLARGAIPVDEVVEIAEQIAQALEAAHDKGIVHRDLKPANVKLTPEGKVKVLDFGLAKAWAGEEPDGSSPSVLLSQSPTLAQTATMAGVILGTAAYMSPEQARGKPVDRRADIWAFGVLVWEMLTGHTLFSGDTVTDVIAAVVTKEPDLEALPAETPPTVRRLVERCLRKDPRTRLPDIGAARLELQDLLSGATSEVVAATAPSDEVLAAQRKGRMRERWIWVAVALAAFGAALTFDYLSEDPPPPRPPAGRFVVDAPDGWIFHSWGGPVPSPDGSQIVFRAVPEGAGDPNASVMLWARPLEALSSRLLAGTEGAEHPFWSPDGQFVAFFAEGELRKLNLANGTIQRICAVPGTFYGGGNWGAEGRILFAAGVDRSDTIYTVAAAGGEPELLMGKAEPESAGGFAQPRFLPGESNFTTIVYGLQNTPTGVYVASIEDPVEMRSLLEGTIHVQYAGGYAFFVQDSTLLAQIFDSEQAVFTGMPVAIATGVGEWAAVPGFGWFGVSPQGTLAYLTDRKTSGEVQLTWLDHQGKTLGTMGDPGNYGQIMLSPDERNLAVEIRSDETGYDLWVMDVARGVASRVTTGAGDERNPVWVPDGRSLVYSVLEDGQTDLRRKGLRAGDPETKLFDTEEHEYPESWSPDGQDLFFIRRATVTEETSLQSIWALNLESEGEPEPLVSFGFTVDEPRVSPDGRWLAYASNESGQWEVYVEPYGREGERIRVSVDGGGQPKWRGDSRELFFASVNGDLMSVAFRAEGDRAEVELPTKLFELGGFLGPEYDDYAPSSDGQRFLVKLPVEESQVVRMHVVTNWQSLLE